MKKYYEEIDILKGIAIILVIIGHAIILYPINLHEIDWCNYIFQFVSIAHMPLFFLISGFCFNIGNKSYKEYIKSKIYRILIPYLVFSFIDLFPRILLPKLLNRPTNLLDGVSKVLFYGGEYWFLYTLFIIFIIYPFLYRFISSGSKKNSICLVTILLLLHFIPLPNILLMSTAKKYLLFFTIGNLIKQNLSTFEILNKKATTGINIFFEVIIFSLMLAYSINLTNLETINYILYTILTLLIELLGIYFWYVFAKSIKKLNSLPKKLFVLCGKYSLQLYLFNGFLLVICRTFIVNVLKVQIPIIIILFNSVVPIVITLLSIIIINKFRILKLLTGLSTPIIKEGNNYENK